MPDRYPTWERDQYLNMLVTDGTLSVEEVAECNSMSVEECMAAVRRYRRSGLRRFTVRELLSGDRQSDQ